MYYPYLRGRHFELIALREYALKRGDNNNIIPIIEPVKNTFNSMKLALLMLIEGSVKFALILNPKNGQEIGINEALKDELKDTLKWIPAFILTNNYSEISAFIESYEYSEVMLICTESTDATNHVFNQLIDSPLVKYIVTKENKTLKRRFNEKDFILLTDNFKAQKSNSDYLTMPDEKFTE